MFHANNRGKRSVALDIKADDAVVRLKKLARDADILIQNLRPDVVEPLGVGPDALLALNPRLIYCSIWAFDGVAVPCSPINDIAELAQSEQLAAMDLLRTLPGSDMQVVGLPISFDRQRPHPQGDSPALGAHTGEGFGRR